MEEVKEKSGLQEFLDNVELRRSSRSAHIQKVDKRMKKIFAAYRDFVIELDQKMESFNAVPGIEGGRKLKVRYETRCDGGGIIGPGIVTFYLRWYENVDGSKQRVSKTYENFRSSYLKNWYGPLEVQVLMENARAIKMLRKKLSKLQLALSKAISQLFALVKTAHLDKDVRLNQEIMLLKSHGPAAELKAQVHKVEELCSQALYFLQRTYAQLDSQLDEYIMMVNTVHTSNNRKQRNGSVVLSWVVHKNRLSGYAGPSGPYWYVLNTKGEHVRRVRIKEVTKDVIKRNYLGAYRDKLLQYGDEVSRLKQFRDECNEALTGLTRFANSTQINKLTGSML